MKKNIKTIWSYIAGGATVLSYQALYDSIQANKSGVLMKEQLDRMEVSLSNLEKNVSASKVTPEIKVQALSHNNNIKNRLHDIQEIHGKIFNNPEVTSEEERLGLFKEYWPIFEGKFKQMKESSSEIDKIFKIEDSDFFWDNNPIFNLIFEFKEFLSGLSTNEICLVANICSCFFMLSCFISIIFAVYGNFFIEKLSLEKRFPRLSGIIRLRAKLQHTYIFINSLLIIINLGVMVYFNYLTLIYG